MPQPEPAVAIVGIGCLFPRSPDLSTYWANILEAADCVTEVPPDHSWTVEEYVDPDPHKPDRTWVSRGGFLEKVPFDPIAYGIPPNQLESIDTTQLLSLIVAREALRDAGLDPDGSDWDRDRVSCILGVTGTQELAVSLGSRLNGHIWRKALRRCGVDERVAEAVVQDIGNHMPTWTEQSFPGLLGNVVAGRIANRLDLGGTNCVVDAACASSLAAIQYAIADLLAGRSDVALTGGADTLNDAFMFQCFTRTPAFSRSNDARPFDAAGDGILIGEGIAILALKRLEDAERDGDRVYAVIKAIGSSSDGRYKSIYAPNPAGQAKALRRTYEAAGVSPATVELVEAHGTGTRAGDVAEVEGLKQVFSGARSGRWCAIGSVKSQIGHTKSTAGAAGLVKAALALHQRVLPPTAKIEQPNPKMGWEQSPFYLSPRPRPWIRAKDHPRRAAVSAFGFGGSNFHAVLEEHGDDRAAVPLSAAPAELFLFGGPDVDTVRDALDRLAQSEAPTLAHKAREVLERWAPGAVVVGFVAGTEGELADRIGKAKQALAGERALHVFVGTDLTCPRVGFLFPGQGSQYVEMGGTLALRHPAFRAALDEADEAFRQAGREPLSGRIYPPPAWTPDEQEAQEQALTATEWAQPAIGAVSRGLAELLATFGVRPDAAAGHSYGELVALHVAGALPTDAFFTASRIRGELMGSGDDDRGTMAAVGGPLELVEEALAGHDVVLANRNHPEQAVISGSREAVRAAGAALEARGLKVKPLPVSAAFHSPLVEDAVAPFAEALDVLDVRPPELPVYSCVSAAPYPADADAVRAQLAQQITRPVDFLGVVQAMVQGGVQVLVEVGPKGVLAGLAQKCAPDVPVVALDRNGHRGDDGDLQLKLALARLAAAGVPVDVSPLLRERLPASPRRPGSAATVWLAGANHRNPETLDPPMPELPKPAPAAAPSASWLDVPSSGQPMAPPPHLERSTPEPSPPPPPVSSIPTASPAASALPADQLATLLASTRETLSAFQRAQERTAEVHGQFLEAWSRSADSFSRLFETHARLVELATTGQAAALPSLAAPPSLPQPPPQAPPVAPRPVAAPVASPPEEPAAADDVGRVAPISTAVTAVADDLPPLFDALAAVQGRSGTATPPQPKPAGPSPEVLEQAVLAAVAEKTGYPVDMLEPAMDLESDLGVDSIKRVEILSAVGDRVPGLPDLDNDSMSALRTLADVVRYLGDAAGSASPAPTPSILPSRPAGPDSSALQAALLASVAEKTGYPVDMLDLSMDLESDLGVDSIKRVEILSAVGDRVPGLPDLDNDRMSALRTLQDVLGMLTEVTGQEPPVLSAGLPTADLPRGELPPAPKAHLSPEALMDAVFGAVADKTGYPRDMLELAMDLESDLGVDSIKRVEILSAVSDRLPDLPELDNDLMSSLRTLQDVVDHLAGVSAGLGFALIGHKATGPAPTLLLPPSQEVGTPKGALGGAVEDVLPPILRATELSPPPHADRPLQRRVVRVVPASPPGARVELDGPLVLTADRGGLAPRLAQALQARGVQAQVVDPADWSDPDAITDIIPPHAAGAVHLAALGATGDDLAQRVRGAFLVARALKGRQLFATVSQLGGRFGQDGAGIEPLQGALAGLPKTLRGEWPGVHAVAVDLADGVSVEDVADVLLSRREDPEIGLAPGLVALKTTPEALPAADGAPPVEPGEVVVVSGGARGVTAAVALEMARRWKPALVLLGRSPLADDPDWAQDIEDHALKARCIAHLRETGARPSPKEVDRAVRQVQAAREVRRNLEALEAAGATVRYLAVDVRDADAVREALSGLSIAGIVHGAGVIADKRVEDKAPEQFNAVFSTKVDGLENLLAATGPELKLLTVFSSTAGRYGNPGQCDYAMANEALVHRLLALRGRPGLRVVAFDWGPWKGGMVDASLERAFAERGLGLISLEAGARAFCDEVERGEHVEVVYEGARPLEGRVVRRISVDEAPWLVDHTIGDKPVVPVAVVMRWIGELAREVYPDLEVTALRDVAVLKGIQVDEPVALTLSWSPVAGRDRALSVEITGKDGPLGPQVHYRAVVELGERPAAPAFPGSNGLGAEPFPHPVEEAYARWLFHGPSFHVIDEIVGMSPHGLVAWVQAGAPEDVVVDSAMQLMSLWVRATQESAALPSYVRAYQQFRPLSGRAAWHVELAEATPRRGRFQATLVGEDGAVLARIDEAEYTADPALIPRFRGR